MLYRDLKKTGDKRAMRNAMEWWERVVMEDSYYCDFVLEEWKEVAKKIGFYEPSFYNDNYWWMYASSVDTTEILKVLTDGFPSEYQWAAEAMCFKVDHELQWVHMVAAETGLFREGYRSNVWSVEYTGDGCPLTDWTPEKTQDELECFEKAVNEFMKDMARAVGKAVEKEYEWQSSEEALLETEYEFDEDGFAVS